MKINRVKFSYELARGSMEQRRDKATDLSQKLFDNILLLKESDNTIPVRQIERVYKSTMPEPIYFKVKQLDKKYSEAVGGTMYSVYDDNSRIIGYSIQIPAKANRMAVIDTPNLFHETRHMLDFLFNPKFIKTEEKIYDNRALSDYFDKLYKNFFYDAESYENTQLVDLKKLEIETKAILKKLNLKKKLVLLNYLKESIQSEINAYKAEEKFAFQMLEREMDASTCLYKETNKKYQFEKKIKIINRMIKDIILKERYEIAKEHAAPPSKRLKLAIKYCFKKLI